MHCAQCAHQCFPIRPTPVNALQITEGGISSALHQYGTAPANSAEAVPARREAEVVEGCAWPADGEVARRRFEVSPSRGSGDRRIIGSEVVGTETPRRRVRVRR